MKTRVHINLAVRNLADSVGFYAKLFGRDPTKNLADYANFRMDRPALHLALVQAPADLDTRAGSAKQHFGIELFDARDLEQWQAAAREEGLTLRTEEEVTCCYAKGSKFWASDPDGNEWEFWVRTAEADRMREEQATGACCAPAGAAAQSAAEPCCTPQAKAEAQAAGASCC